MISKPVKTHVRINLYERNHQHFKPKFIENQLKHWTVSNDFQSRSQLIHSHFQFVIFIILPTLTLWLYKPRCLTGYMLKDPNVFLYCMFHHLFIHWSGRNNIFTPKKKKSTWHWHKYTAGCSINRQSPTTLCFQTTFKGEHSS